MEKNNKKPNRISYDDILANMGLYVENGTLHKGNKPEKVNPITNNKDNKSIESLSSINMNKVHNIHTDTPIKKRCLKKNILIYGLNKKFNKNRIKT